MSYFVTGATGFIGRRLIGDEGSAGVVLLTAASPIPVLYATFGRPHTLLFAWLMWSTLLPQLWVR